MSSINTTTFKDTSIECAICLASLSSSPTIELTCGHKWHLSCLKDQLEHAQPDHTRRLLFSGCRCAKCGTFCEHEFLDHLTRKTDALRHKVDKLIEEQLAIDDPSSRNRTTDDDENDENEASRFERARRRYAFYLCASCDEPYFGGTIECADEDEGERRTGDDRLCPTCSPRPQEARCRNPSEHAVCHVWKCRYCCRPANHVCYGTVHFCQECHDRNDERVRRRRRERKYGRTTGGGGESLEVPLAAIPCAGESCTYPKPEGKSHHENGASPSGEQVYYCARCRSSEASMEGAIRAEGSRNFLENPSGARGISGWRPFQRAAMWKVETSDVPVDESTTTNFVSSYNWCAMYQIVPLHSYVRRASEVRTEVSAKFMGRTDCPSVFQMKAIVLDAGKRPIREASTARLVAPADGWERVSLILEPVRGAHDVVIVVLGKDERFWAGNFGSKVADCCVRVLCSETELENILRQDVVNRQESTNRCYASLQLLRTHAFDILLPFLLLFALWYL